ncbi:hypothetical protein HETIRDRAFT_322976, partial [Heterobasidion irregulare TC 32-1]
VTIVRKSKVGEKILFAKVIGDGVASSKEHSSEVSQMVSIQKIGLHGINRGIEFMGDRGDCSKSARSRIKEIGRSSDQFSDEGGVKKKVKLGGGKSNSEDSRTR